jgi:ribosomal protein S18 acetylase RimI-like enzyme
MTNSESALPIDIEHYSGDFEESLDLLQMSMGITSMGGVKHLLAIEQARGTRYHVARQDGQIIGLIGVWFDPSSAVCELEPPQIIDMAVLPAYRRKGVARALMQTAIRETRAAGHTRLWLYTDGNSTGLLTFYRRLGFKLAAVIPDWFGDGTVKAYFRMDLV